MTYFKQEVQKNTIMSKIEVIKFGTDGWRAIIGENYTFENVKRVSLATARHFRNHPKINNGIVIGYDTRFLSKEFAHCSAEVFANEGIKVFLTDSFVTTPTISLMTRDLNLAFGVVITASHNPYKYNGYKLKDEFGGSMGNEELKNIEEQLKDINEVKLSRNIDELIKLGIINYINGREFYINNLKEKIDFKLISDLNKKVIYDPMFGAGQGILKELVNAEEIHSEINPYFSGGGPEPVERNLSEILNKVREQNFDIGIITDGDADRIAIIDEKGQFLNAQKTFALLLLYLHRYKKYDGKVVRGYSTSEIIEKYCDKYNLKLETVPIGFKYISKIMITEDVLIGAEESGGIGIKGHLPERDGIYNGLLFLEMISKTNKTISELINELEVEFGKYYYNRKDVHTTEDKKLKTLQICSNLTIGKSIGGKQILKIDNLDGFKFTFSNGWIIIRPSGTEPLLRFYCETKEKDETLEVLNQTIKQLNLL